MRDKQGYYAHRGLLLAYVFCQCQVQKFRNQNPVFPFLAFAPQPWNYFASSSGSWCPWRANTPVSSECMGSSKPSPLSDCISVPPWAISHNRVTNSHVTGILPWVPVCILTFLLVKHPQVKRLFIGISTKYSRYSTRWNETLSPGPWRYIKDRTTKLHRMTNCMSVQICTNTAGQCN